MTVASGNPELEIIIVNYRTPHLVVDCLTSLQQERSDVNFRVIVVENGSGDDSRQIIHEAIVETGWTDWISILNSDANLGFAGGNNYGLSRTKDSKFVLLLNSDTIVQRGCLRRCLDVMNANPSIGALSCKLLNRDRTIQNAARRFPHPFRITLSQLGFPRRWPGMFAWANLQHPGWDRNTESRSVEWIGGAFLMIPRTVLNTVGFLDEDFFFYGEDVEFCHRVHRAGYLCWYEASVSTVHLGAGSSDDTRLPRGQRNKHRTRARYLKQQKLYGRWASIWVWTVDAIMDALRSTRDLVFRPDSNKRPATRIQNRTD
ncbi:MAG: glycosyltransferase family 2 protein [Fuerstiella sp.]